MSVYFVVKILPDITAAGIVIGLIPIAIRQR
jgi:hypothetical protein